MSDEPTAQEPARDPLYGKVLSFDAPGPDAPILRTPDVGVVESAPPVAPAEVVELETPINADPPKLAPKDAYQMLNSTEALLKQAPVGDVMIAVRCPCGFMMGLSAPLDLWSHGAGREVAIQMGSKLIPMLAEHLEQLTEVLARYDAVPMNRRADPAFPTRDQIIASYHNAPCPLRVAAPSDVVVPTAQDTTETNPIDAPVQL